MVAAEDLNSFKNALDKFWFHLEIKFDGKAEIL